jgi:late competence protein required for DNA uptake (superfamily II DNA/RNA helicase)
MDWILLSRIFWAYFFGKKAQKKELPNSATRFGLYQSRLTNFNILLFFCQEKSFEKFFEFFKKSSFQSPV